MEISSKFSANMSAARPECAPYHFDACTIRGCAPSIQYVHVQPPVVSVSAHAPNAAAAAASIIISFFVISLFLSNRFPCGAMGSSRPTVPPHFTTSQWPVSGTTLIFGLLSTSLKRLSLSPSADISAWGNAANWAASFRPIPFPVPDTMRSCADAHGSKTGFSSESGEYPSQTSVCAPTLPHYQGGPLQSPARQESNLHRHGLPHD